MGNSIIGKMVVMMVGGGGGQRWWWRVTAAQQAKVRFSLLRMSDEIYKPTPRRCASVVRRLRRGCHEPLRGAAPRGVVVARQLSPASQGLLELCAFVFLFLCGEAGEERERVCVCKNVDVQEAQREAFPFTVAAYRMRKSPECMRRAHSSASSLRKLHEGNTCFCKQAPCDTDHPLSGEVFALISSSLLIYFFFTIILPIATLLTFPQPNLAG